MAEYVFGIDVGGTTVKCGLFRVDGTVLDKWEIETRTEGEGSPVSYTHLDVYKRQIIQFPAIFTPISVGDL